MQEGMDCEEMGPSLPIDKTPRLTEAQNDFSFVICCHFVCMLVIVYFWVSLYPVSLFVTFPLFLSLFILCQFFPLCVFLIVLFVSL